MNESTRLLSKKGRRPNLEEQYNQSEDLTFSPFAKAAFCVLAIIFCPLILYFLIVYLPNKYIPDAVDIGSIQKVSILNMSYVPLSKERSEELGLYENLAIEPNVLGVSFEVDMDIGEKNEELDSKIKKERLIMIGDIHAHLNKFKQLLGKIKYNPETDYVVMLGDFISKGPDSLELLDFAISNDFDCILGNHEYSILQYYALYHRLSSPVFGSSNTSDIVYNRKLDVDPEFLIAKKMLPEHIMFLNKCSVMKKLGKVPIHSWTKKNKKTTLTDGVAVHAGIRWDLALEDQDPMDNLQMRAYIGPYYNETSDDDSVNDAVTWSKIYNQKQKMKENNEDTLAVYYGHYAKKGLTLKKFSKGLDSGCDAGNYLSAIIIWNEIKEDKKGKQIVHYKEKVAQVNCNYESS